jgi:predicted secreted Zn-dependent protease
VTWHFRWNSDVNGECKITEVHTVLTGTITLPKLVNGSGSQARDMDTFSTALRVHELGHYNIGKDAADAIDNGILSLPQMRDCKVLDSAANQLGQRILEEHRKTEEQYDIATAHGKSQGAWLSH